MQSQFAKPTNLSNVTNGEVESKVVGNESSSTVEETTKPVDVSQMEKPMPTVKADTSEIAKESLAIFQSGMENLTDSMRKRWDKKAASFPLVEMVSLFVDSVKSVNKETHGILPAKDVDRLAFKVVMKHFTKSVAASASDQLLKDAKLDFGASNDMLKNISFKGGSVKFVKGEGGELQVVNVQVSNSKAYVKYDTVESFVKAHEPEHKSCAKYKLPDGTLIKAQRKTKRINGVVSMSDSSWVVSIQKPMAKTWTIEKSVKGLKERKARK